MPPFDPDQFRELLLQGKFNSISIDTSIFDRYNCAVESVPLAAMSQFKGKGIQFILSEVVVSEVEAHLTEKNADTKDKLSSALKKYHRQWRRDFDLDALTIQIGLPDDPHKAAQKVLKTFVDSTAAEVIYAEDYVEMGDLLLRYFTPEPPFSKTKAKKSEFPDAIALLSLEDWARGQDAFMVAVSSDHDWKTFAEQSDHLFCVTELPAALALFNEQDGLVARRTAEMLRAGGAPDLNTTIDRAIDGYFNEIEPDFHGEHPFDYELDASEAEIQYWHVNPEAEPKVLLADADTVTFSLECEVTVEFKAYFSVSVWDSVDKEYVNMGDDLHKLKKTVQIEVIVEIERAIDPVPIVQDITISAQDFSVNFGSLEPRWGEEE